MNILPQEFINSVAITLINSLHNHNLFNQANLSLIGVYRFVLQSELKNKLKFKEVFESDSGNQIELELLDKLLSEIINLRPNELYRLNYSEITVLKKQLLDYITQVFNIDSTSDVDIEDIETEINKELYKLAKEILDIWFDESNKVKEYISLDNLNKFTDEYIKQIKNVAFEWYKELNKPDSFRKFLELLEKSKLQTEKKTLLIRVDEQIVEDIFSEVGSEIDNAARYVYPLNDYKILETRRVLVAAAPPGGGKSQLLRHITAEAFQNANVENPERDRNLIFYFSFENTRAETFAGILANITDIPVSEIFTVWKQPKKYTDELNKLKQLFQSKVPVYNILSIIEYPTKDRPTVDYIKSEIEKQVEYLTKEGYNVQLYAVVVDYLGLISPTSNVSSAYERLGEALKELKAMAMQMNTAVFTAAQVNRQGTSQLKKKGIIEQEAISDSWRILQEADVVLGLALKKLVDSDDDTTNDLPFDRTGNLTILKHRYHREGIIPVNADYSRSKFFKASDNIPMPSSLFANNDTDNNSNNKLPIQEFEQMIDDTDDEFDFDIE